MEPTWVTLTLTLALAPLRSVGRFRNHSCFQVIPWGRSSHPTALSSTRLELRGSTTPGRSLSSP